MTDNYRRYSETLVQNALVAIGRGDPRAVGFLADVYDYLHPESRRAVFEAIKQRFELAWDGELAQRVRAEGTASLATVHPQLARAIRTRNDAAYKTMVQDLTRPKFGDINATTPQARFLRTLLTGLPLHSVLGAWLRVRAQKALAATVSFGQCRWGASVPSGTAAKKAEATKRPKHHRR